MNNDTFFLIFCVLIPFTVLGLIKYNVHKAFKKPKPVSTIFERMKKHEAEIKNPPLLKRLKKLLFKTLPYVTGFLLKWFKFLIYFIPSYLLLKLFNL